ncbi:transcriptional regulatory protein c terminal [Trichococcus palustris]|jgi:two-component system, OmpR family, phosphate regulon response regulator OmpR|uniref:Transcriptional regulatory protein c terminal n=1 Tax=Trichococcus palustris TaxID=140314 RepID=A0A143YLX0_9LACT|nr:response regulator transcription factor [Trichococcus palustris]CZQ92565.1 transcriptional regulatory protein c terminal [Trichococcus palustris]SFL05542.1 DNA-binding response regulator, OmpR family, contains REC and winged-helix (wHTH) domain [Trichococcus palustris]
MSNQKILVVDDDIAIRRLIWKSLQSTGILIYQSDSIEKTLDIMTRVTFDMFLLDISLEYENDGYHLAQLIREQQPLTPIIFISGKKSESDIISGLETGADYYITKPFSPNILRAQIIGTLERMKTIQSQKTNKNDRVIEIGDFKFDKNLYQLEKKGQLIPLSSKEVQLMLFFMENPNQVFSKEQIYANVWNDGEMDNNLIMVYISYLRNKIEDESKKPRYLKTVWGIGYTFSPDGQ